MEHASDVLSPRPVQTHQELNLEKLAKRKTKKTRLSFKQGTAEYAILDQVIKCWFAKEGDYWPGQSVGTREYLRHVLGPVPGVDVMAKRSQGWVKCEDRLPYYRDSSCSLPLPRLHDSRGPRGGGGGARGKGPARVGLLGLQCSARALFRTASFKKYDTRIASLD
jgi:hypothetical protein